MKKTPTSKHDRSVAFISLGCAKNLVDTQLMACSLIKNKIPLAPSPDEADVLVINTCAFIREAREEAYQAINEAIAVKDRGGCRFIIVSGCLSQRYKDDVIEQFPKVDAIVGLDDIVSIADVVRKLEKGETGLIRVGGTSKSVFDPDVPGVVFTGGPYAYIKISEGCNHACNFCAIPQIRGRFRSRSINSIKSEAEQLLENGYRELNLIAQDTSAYGSDMKDKTSLPWLLKEISKIGGNFWIRILYTYPSLISRVLLETIAELPRVVPYIDVPVQHSHPEILKKMGRGSTISMVEDITGQIKNVLPDATIRTTCLVGFPGESQRHFDHLSDYITKQQFDHLGVFTFCPEEGTRAAKMRPRPRNATAEKRRHELLMTQRDIVNEKSRFLIGEYDQALLENPTEDGEWIGRTRRFAPEVDGVVLISKVPPGTVPGDFINVCYTEQAGYDMIADFSPSRRSSQSAEKL